MFPRYIRAKNLADAWIRALSLVFREGSEIRTETGILTKDLPILMYVADPFQEPRIHKAAPLQQQREEYVKQITEGTEKKFAYDYHKRLFHYEVGEEEIDQIKYVKQKLQNSPTSRRAIAVTWQPWIDEEKEDVPCLTIAWFRAPDKLDMQVVIRSNDLYKAAPLNMYGFTALQKKIATSLKRKVGSYTHYALSAHIYEHDWKAVKKIIQ